MTKKTFITLVFSLLFVGFLSGCSKKYDPENPIQGTWVLDKGETVGDDVIYNFHRASQFDKDKSGYAFKANGLLVSRQNTGWCGTPPVSYVETQGAWSKTGDKIMLDGIYWGGKFKLEFEINQLNRNQLEVKQLSAKYN